MEAVFSRILNMSLTGSAVILCVLLARLALRKAPKKFSYALWAVVLFRLLCPVSLPSPVSLLELAKPQVSQSQGLTSSVSYQAVEYVYSQAAVDLPEFSPQENTPSEATPQKAPISPMTLAAWVWLAGVGCLALYSGIGYLRLRRKLVGAVPYRGNAYLADHIATPFVLGVLFPKIYIPFSVPHGERHYILAHERCHIRRGDPVWKLLAYAALCVHWFNPLVWVSFLLAEKDMEMSCDEAVIRKLSANDRANYASALLRLSTGKKVLSGVAFGEGDTKSRILNMAKWKKPKVWITTLCVVLCVAVLAVCGLNPEKEQDIGELTQVSGPISIGYGNLYFRLPEGLTSELEERENASKDDGIHDYREIFTDGTNVIGGIQVWDTPSFSLDNGYDGETYQGNNYAQWVQALGLPEAQGTMVISGMIEDTLYGDLEAEYWKAEDLKEYNVIHYFYIDGAVVYDVWFDQNLISQDEIYSIMETAELQVSNSGAAPNVPAETAQPVSAADAYHSAFLNTDGRVDFQISAALPAQWQNPSTWDALPHYLTESDIQRAAYAIFGADAAFTEAAPRFESYTATREQLLAAIERCQPYTESAAWDDLCGNDLHGFSSEEYADTAKQLVEEWNRQLASFRNDYPEQPCQWTLQNSAYYSYAPENTSSDMLAEFGDAIEAYVQKDGISYRFEAYTRDKENFKINNLFVWPEWPVGFSELERLTLYRDLCASEPTPAQIEAAQIRASQILADMNLGQWYLDRCYVEVITYHNPDVPEYVIHVNALPLLDGAEDLARIQHGNINQSSQEPTCADNYYLTQAEFTFAPGGELLELNMYSPMDVTLSGKADQVWPVDDLLSRVEEELKASSINDYGLDVDEMGYASARCSVSISQIRTGMARVRVEGTEEGYRYVPALAVYGTAQYQFSDGNQLQATEEPYNLMMLNALDGSVILPYSKTR